jgi:hypothetical protein
MSRYDAIYRHAHEGTNISLSKVIDKTEDVEAKEK